MKRKIRVVEVPECGYIPIGRIGTFHEQQVIEFDDSELDPKEIKSLLEVRDIGTFHGQPVIKVLASGLDLEEIKSLLKVGWIEFVDES